MNTIRDYLKEKYWKGSQTLRVLAFLLILASVALFIWWAMAQKNIELHSSLTFFKNENIEDLYVNATTAPYALPSTLRIPSINIEAPFEGSIGLDEEGAILVPNGYDTVGWYSHGPVPGSLGPSVILGHVDSKEGPAVFFYLGQVKKGDEVIVDREDGSSVIYTITELERVEQGTFPTEKVYGSLPYAGIRLITCSGSYDRGEKRYSHNLIVYGELLRVE
jgi:LPXTG-site transpeptidase (sortase) family protein